MFYVLCSSLALTWVILPFPHNILLPCSLHCECCVAQGLAIIRACTLVLLALLARPAVSVRARFLLIPVSVFIFRDFARCDGEPCNYGRAFVRRLFNFLKKFSSKSLPVEASTGAAVQTKSALLRFHFDTLYAYA